ACRDKVQILRITDFLTSLDVRTFKTYYKRNIETDILDCLHNTFSNDVTFHDAAENIDKDTSDTFIAEDDLECFGNFLSCCAAPYIEEVGRFSAEMIDRIHSCHRKTCTVHHAADVSIEGNV